MTLTHVNFIGILQALASDPVPLHQYMTSNCRFPSVVLTFLIISEQL